MTHLRPGVKMLFSLTAIFAAGHLGWAAASLPAPVKAPPKHPVAAVQQVHVVHHLKLASRGAVSRDPYRALYQETGAKYGVPWPLLEAQGYVESRWNPKAVRVDGPGSWDVGLAQINTLYHPRSAWPTFGNPKAAIQWQAKHMARYYRETGSWVGALWLYHRGPDKARWHGEYAARVLAVEGRLAG